MTSNVLKLNEEIQRNDVSPHALWDYCPIEILLIIFRKLDATSLRCCLAVNTKWKEIAVVTCENQGLWQELAEDGLVNHGVSLYTKSTLSWKDLYYNSILWDNVQHAVISKTCETENLNIKNMHIYKDNIIIISEISVEYFNIETFEFVNVISLLCEDFQETDDIVLVAKSFDGIDYELTLFQKMDGQTDYLYIQNHFRGYYYHNFCTISRCRLWLIQNNSCFAIDRKHVLWKAYWTAENWYIKSLAKYYGCHSIQFPEKSPLDFIHVINEEVYVSLKWGDLIEVNQSRFSFQKVRTSTLTTFYSIGPNIFKKPPSTNGNLGKFSALINVPVGSGFLEEFRDHSKLHFHYDDPEMTYALQHGAVVILGFDDGRLEIQSLKKRKYQKQFPTTVVKLNVTDFDNAAIDDPAIRGIEVCELKNMHKLFVKTSRKLYHLLFKYPEYLLES